MTNYKDLNSFKVIIFSKKKKVEVILQLHNPLLGLLLKEIVRDINLLPKSLHAYVPPHHGTQSPIGTHCVGKHFVKSVLITSPNHLLLGHSMMY